MTKNILIVFVVLFAFACGTIKKRGMSEDESLLLIDPNVKYEMQKKGINFSASGVQPEWLLEIDFDKKVKFSSPDMNKNFEVDVLTLGKGLKGSDATHEIKSTDGDLTVTIKTKDDACSKQGQKAFEVDVSFLNNKTSKVKKFTGEGEFYGDIRLHDIWILEAINGDKLSTKPEGRGAYMEIHLDKDKVMGSLGCNTFSCGVYFGREQICFSPILSTKMACLHDDVESRFSKALYASKFNYSFEKLNLILVNETDTLVFRKGD